MQNKNRTKVQHNLDDLKEGEDIILTLQDQNILDNNGEILDDDVLENIDLKEKEKLDHKKLMSSKSALQQHFDSQAEQEGKRNILQKYDDIPLEKEGFLLNDEGEVMPNTKASLDLIRKKLQNSKNNSNKTIYQSKNNNIVASEYKEESEEQKLKKKKGFQKRVLKDKQKQKQQQQNLAEFLEENVENENHMENHGNREELNAKRKKEEIIQKIADKKQKQEQYQNAVNQSLQESQKAQMRWKEEEDDIEQQLMESIQKQQRMKEALSNNEEAGGGEEEQVDENQQHKQENGNTNNSKRMEERVLDLCKQNQEIEDEIKERQKQQLESQENISKPKPRAKGMKHVEYIKDFSINQDFLKNVDTDEQSKEHRRMEQMQTASLSQAAQGTTSVATISLPSERQLGLFKRQQELYAQIPDMTAQITEEEMEELKKQTEMLKDENLGNGLTTTLKRLRENGQLMDSNYDFRGRNNDEMPFQERHKSNGSMDIEYRDHTGRLMTKKEAFRYQCHIFHGQGPSKKTIERQQKKELFLEQQRQRQSNNESVILDNLKQSQKQTNQAFMKINFGKNNKQSNS